MRAGKLFPIAAMFHPFGKDARAETTGEFREPKKGEWYISGALSEAYQAPNDLSTKFNIAIIVQTVSITTTIRRINHEPV